MEDIDAAEAAKLVPFTLKVLTVSFVNKRIVPIGLIASVPKVVPIFTRLKKDPLER